MAKDGDYVGRLADYIKKNLKKGYTKESLKWALVHQGHSRGEIDKAIHRVDAELASEAPILQTRPEITVEVIEPHNIEKKPLWKRLLGL